MVPRDLRARGGARRTHPAVPPPTGDASGAVSTAQGRRSRRPRMPQAPAGWVRTTSRDPTPAVDSAGSGGRDGAPTVKKRTGSWPSGVRLGSRRGPPRLSIRPLQTVARGEARGEGRGGEDPSRGGGTRGVLPPQNEGQDGRGDEPWSTLKEVGRCGGFRRWCLLTSNRLLRPRLTVTPAFPRPVVGPRSRDPSQGRSRPLTSDPTRRERRRRPGRVQTRGVAGRTRGGFR